LKNFPQLGALELSKIELTLCHPLVTEPAIPQSNSQSVTFGDSLRKFHKWKSAALQKEGRKAMPTGNN
jgi:hypothetical protein